MNLIIFSDGDSVSTVVCSHNIQHLTHADLTELIALCIGKNDHQYIASYRHDAILNKLADKLPEDFSCVYQSVPKLATIQGVVVNP